MKTFKQFPFYIIPFSLYPIIAFASHNIAEDHLCACIRPLIISVLFSIILYSLGHVIYKDNQKAGLFALLSIVVFFSFGHLLITFENTKIFGYEIGRLKIIGPVVIIISGALVILIKKFNRISPKMNSLLTFCSVALLVYPILNIAQFSLNQIITNSSKTINTGTISANNNLPDIYFIILDSYTRQDALKEVYHFDNSEFLNDLRKMGFFIAECSRSNYQYTLLSLSATLNMDYRENIDERIKLDRYQASLLSDLIQHSKTRSLLQEQGYKFVAIENSYIGTKIPDSDIYIRYKSNTAKNMLNPFITPYEQIFLKTTAGIILYRLPLGRFGDYINKISFPYYDLAQNQLFQLDVLPTLIDVPGPKFVFMHMNIPHRPFILRPDGSIQTDTSYYGNDGGATTQKFEIDGYVDQIKFLNNRLPSIIAEIIRRSKQNPVIIIQGDHGLDTLNRSLILNSIYPATDLEETLYHSMSPVNTFRVVLNQYLGYEFELLPDISYDSHPVRRYEMEIIPETSPACTQNGNIDEDK